MIALPLSKPGLFAYTPHQGEMLLLDRLEEYTLEPLFLKAGVDARATSQFYDQETGLIPMWVAFEYMAQSIALLAGVHSVERAGEKPKIGFIMGIRNFEAQRPGFAPGQRIEVTVREIFRDGDVGVFEGRAEADGALAATGVINTIAAGETLMNKIKGQADGK